MNDDNLKFFKDLYNERLKIISDIKFTSREIDIVSCILNGRTAKGVASLLSISSKTVEAHIYNIMSKINVCSREGIINFIEKSQKLSILRQYYSELVINSAFEKGLLELSKIGQKNALPELIVYCSNENLKNALLKHLTHHLKRAGIIPTTQEKDFKKETAPDSLPHTQIVILDKEEEQKFPAKIDFIDLINCQNYCFAVFEILKKLMPNSDIEKTYTHFKEQYEGIHTSTFGVPENDILKEEVRKSISLPPEVTKKPKWNFLIIMSLIGISLFVFWKTIENFSQIENSKDNSIRSDLLIPTESVLLPRPEILNQIDEKLKKQHEIQTVALVGMGGAGKTTIARHYARNQQLALIWEINAETLANLINSFENLAYALAKTENEKNIIKGLQEIKNPQEREEKVIAFVKQKLKALSNWLLIYDNMEKFLDLQKYFPLDPNTWGKGKIIITTRDHHIKNNSYINYIIKIGELDSKEKLELFTRIMSDGDVDKISTDQKTKINNFFLNQIPSLPLDISTAAYYIKATNTPYEKYLENLNHDNKDFEILQGTVIKEASNYTKTTYGIVTLSLKQLIKTNNEFVDLLLFISLLDSQNIPRDLLSVHKTNVLTDNFIYNLKKYSLITDESHVFIEPLPNFSIHRNIQKISLSFLTKELNLEKNKYYLQAIVNTFENYMNSIMEKENFLKIKLLINHSEMFLNHPHLLTDKMKGIIGNKLGGIYYSLGHHMKAKKLLEESLVKLSNNYTENNTRIAQLLIYLGNVYRELGSYEKAKSSLEQSLLIYKKHLPHEQLGAARALGELGILYRNLGDYEKSKNILEESLNIYKKTSSEYQSGAILVLTYLGIINWDLGDYKEAKNLIEKSVLLYKKYFPENHGGLVKALTYLGSVHRELGNFTKAKDLLEESLAIYKNHLPENHLGIARSLTYLGDVYRELGNYDHAKESLEKSLSIHKEYFPENRAGLAWVLTYLGIVYKDLGEYKKAREVFDESLAIHKDLFGEDNIKTAWALVLSGNMYRELGDYTQAKKALQNSFEIYKKKKNNSMSLAWVSIHLGNLYKNLGNYKEAEILFKQSLSVYEKNYGKNHIKIAHILKCLGQTYIMEGNLETAENLIRKSLEIFQQNHHPDTYIIFEALSDLYLKKANFEMDRGNNHQAQAFKMQAHEYLKRALAIADAHLPKESSHITSIRSKLKSLEEIR